MTNTLTIAAAICILASIGALGVMWHAADQIGKAIGDALRDIRWL